MSAAPPAASGADGLSTRDAIAQSAADLFRTKGYAGTSIRDIASAAGVDPALVMRHYESKDKLFVRVIGFDEHFAPQLDGPLETLGERLAEYLIDPRGEEMRATFAALVLASDHEAIRLDLERIMRGLLVERLSGRMTGRDAELRAWLVSAQLVGLIYSWDRLDGRLDSAAARKRVAKVYGAAIQQLITPPDPAGAA
jgi:AcrR family transcriptional regulator